MMDRIRTRKSLRSAVGAFCLAVSSLAGAANPTGYPIGTERVAAALTAHGLPVKTSQIQFLSEVRTADQDAPLQVVSVSDATPGSSKVRLRCRNSGECLPFYVLIPSLNPEKRSLASLLPGGGSPVIKASSVQYLMRRGDLATLYLENLNSRIQLPVICLENGERGQKIKVTSKDHRLFFEGEIVASGVLRGTL